MFSGKNGQFPIFFELQVTKKKKNVVECKTFVSRFAFVFPRINSPRNSPRLPWIFYEFHRILASIAAPMGGPNVQTLAKNDSKRKTNVQKGFPVVLKS